MKHTEGEWEIDFIRKTNETDFSLKTKGKLSLKEAEANAKLIAQSPNMLKGLMELAHLDDHDCKCKACKIAKPIINKATK